MEFGDFDIFAAKDEVALQGRVLSLNPDQVYPDPENVRRKIDDAEIETLASTIRDRGQLQPITVAAADENGRYRIHFGERRWQACRQLGIPVRAIVSDQADPSQVRIDQFIENDQRAALSSSDMIAFVVAQAKAGRSITELARVTGRDRARLARYHALASAPDFIAQRLDEIPLRGAVALVGAATKAEAATRAFVEAAPSDTLTVLACEQFYQNVRTDEGEVGIADKTNKGAPLQKQAKISDPKPSYSARSSALPNEASTAGNVSDQEQFIEVNGRRARIITAVLQFDGEADRKTIHFAN